MKVINRVVKKEIGVSLLFDMLDRV